VTTDTITIMHMASCQDDVSIDRVKSFHGDLLDIYNAVKNMAIGFAKDQELMHPSKKLLVEIQRNLEGLPSAYVMDGGRIDHVFFGTYESKPEEARFQSALGEF